MRVLIFSADIGEGPTCQPGPYVTRSSSATRMRRSRFSTRSRPPAPWARSLVRKGSEVILERLRLLFEVQYWLIARYPPTRALASRLLTALAGRRLLDVIAHRSRPISAACVIAVGAFR